MKLKMISKSGILPKYETAGSAGFDIRAYIEEPMTLAPGERKLVPTGLYFQLEPGCAAQVRARSGLAIKKGIGLVNGIGTIDSDYRGEFMIVLHNHGTVPQTVAHGERIAQLVITPVFTPGFVETAALSDTVRSGGGFGSTGK